MIENADCDSAADLDNTEIGHELTHKSDETENGVDEIVLQKVVPVILRLLVIAHLQI